ncbi:MAG: thermonuclease family protein [Pseudomonadota bacterium]
MRRRANHRWRGRRGGSGIEGWLTRRRGLVRILLVFAAGIAAGLFQYLLDDTPARVEGTARVIDGDSLRIGRHEIRLVGLDAPEAQQMCRRNDADWACGREATRRLRQRLSGRQLACEVEHRDAYDRLLADCLIDGKSLNRALVTEGWAVAYGAYRAEERAAQAGRRGIWASQFEPPRTWRKINLEGAVAAAAQ